MAIRFIWTNQDEILGFNAIFSDKVYTTMIAIWVLDN
jgi:hypothetical protein